MNVARYLPMNWIPHKKKKKNHVPSVNELKKIIWRPLWTELYTDFRECALKHRAIKVYSRRISYIIILITYLLIHRFQLVFHLQTTMLVHLTDRKPVLPGTKHFNHLELRGGDFYLTIHLFLSGSWRAATNTWWGMPRADRKNEQNFNVVSPSACVNFYWL